MLKGLDGNGTYLVGWAAIAIGVAQMMGWIPPGMLEQMEQAASTLDGMDAGAVQSLGDPMMKILFGAGLIRLRMGGKKAEAKAAEAVEAVKNGVK